MFRGWDTGTACQGGTEGGGAAHPPADAVRSQVPAPEVGPPREPGFPPPSLSLWVSGWQAKSAVGTPTPSPPPPPARGVPCGRLRSSLATGEGHRHQHWLGGRGKVPAGCASQLSSPALVRPEVWACWRPRCPHMASAQGRALLSGAGRGVARKELSACEQGAWALVPPLLPAPPSFAVCVTLDKSHHLWGPHG